MNQRLHLVFGGELVDPSSTKFRDTKQIHMVGIFPDYASAHQAWKAEAQRTVDSAHTPILSPTCTACATRNARSARPRNSAADGRGGHGSWATGAVAAPARPPRAGGPGSGGGDPGGGGPGPGDGGSGAKEICRKYLAGTCTKGASCKYDHPRLDERVRAGLVAMYERQRGER